MERRCRKALIFGVGPDLGAAIARRFARDGYQVGIAARRIEVVHEIALSIGRDTQAFECDVADEAQVKRTFAKFLGSSAAIDVVVFNARASKKATILELIVDDVEKNWRIACLGGFHVGQGAARRMQDSGGAIVFTDATGSIRGGAEFAALAIGKFGLRALAQSMARELGPKGIHVFHVIVDGQIDSARFADLKAMRPDDSFLKPDAIADVYWQVVHQHPTAWTHELDLRPYAERF